MGYKGKKKRQKMNIQKIEIVAKGIHRTVGYIDYDTSTYHTKRQNKNIMRSYYGFGISMPIIDYLLDNDIINIAIHCNGKSYYVSVSKFYIRGFEYSDQNDKQLILPMSYFDNPDSDLCYIIGQATKKELFVGKYSYKPKQADLKPKELNRTLLWN